MDRANVIAREGREERKRERADEKRSEWSG
jgi:hypothetical protein